MPTLGWPAVAEEPGSEQNVAPATAPKGHSLALTASTHARWQAGDIAVTVGVGGRNTVQWLQPDGTLNKSIDISPNTIAQSSAGTAFGPDGTLYVTNFESAYLWEISATGQVGAILNGDFTNAESLAVDAAGHVFVGQAGGPPGFVDIPLIHELDLGGNQLAEWTVSRDTRGTDWISLEPDGCTILYTSEGTTIKRFNFCTATQLSNFASGLPNTAYALHRLADGTVLVADTSSILRLNSAGQIIRTYTAPGETLWFSLDVDPSGTAFWAGTENSSNLYKFDLASGSVLLNLNMGGSVPGISVYGNTAPITGPPGAQTNGGGTNPNGTPTTNMAKEPVNTATGNYTNTVTDLGYPGRGLGFAFGRTYNSQDATVSTLGPGWTDSYAVHLILNGDGSIVFCAEDGSRYLYAPNGSGGYVTPPGGRSTLTAISGGYQILRLDQVKYAFDATGVLQSEKDRNANTLAFAYASGRLSQVTDTVGRIVTLGYDGSGRLATLSGPQSMSVGYAYNGLGQLATVTDVRGGTTNYTYDPGGRLATIVDQNNHTLVTNTYDAAGRVATQLDALNHPTTFGWDQATQTSTVTDARSGVWTDIYASNLLIAKIDPLGNTTTYGYDTALNTLVVTDPRGNSTGSTYDARGNLLSRGSPGAGFVRHTYDAFNDVLTTKDGRGNTTTYTYDATGNLKTRTGPAPVSPVTTYNYDPAGTGLLFSTVDPRLKTTTYGYDGQANGTTITTPLGNARTMTYDAAGRMLTMVDPRGNVSGADPAQFTTIYTYDAAGHVRTVTDPLGHVTTTTYDPAGNKTAVSDANIHTTTYAYDPGNQLQSVTDARLKTTSYTYDATGNQVTRTDPNTHVTTYGYDLAGRRTSELRPLNRLWTYGYDASGNRTTIVDAIGNSTPTAGDGTTTYTYDAANRVSTVAYSDGTPPVVNIYDANGNVTQMTDGVTNTRVFDVLNRPTQVVRAGSPTLEMDYTYDAASNVLTRTALGGSAVSYGYDNDGRLAMMTVGGLATTYTYDAAGNALTTTLPSGNGYVETRTWDRAGALTEVKNTKGATTLSKSTYTLDPVGNRTTVVSTTGTTTLTYDPADRLTQACYTTACTGSDNFRRYTYDDVGNRLTEVTAAGTTTSTYDALDQLVSSSGPAGTVNYTFDLDGRQTAAGTQTFTYDLAGRTKTATVSGTTTTYTYDGDGHRIKASTGSQAAKNTYFVWDANRVVPEVARELTGSGSLLREYHYGRELVSMTSGSSAYYFHLDGLGSVDNVTSSVGITQWTYDYHPYGVPRTTTQHVNKAPANNIRFAGENLDPTGLYHLRARQYDATTGRFLATDPAGCPIGRPYVGSYVYANDNPVRFVDPMGRESQPAAPAKDYSVGKCIGGVIIFFGSEFVGTTFVVGGLLLSGVSITLFGVTFGGATPVTVVGLVAGTALDLAGLAIDIGGFQAIRAFCVEQ